jgi:hypothetical protein
MQRHKLIAILVTAFVVSTAGSADLATAQTRDNQVPGIIDNLARRICVSEPFDGLLRTEFRDIRLNRQQNDTILQAHQSRLNWILDNAGSNACFENGTIQDAWMNQYMEYEAVVRRTLNRRQLQQWNRNVQAILRARQ